MKILTSLAFVILSLSLSAQDSHLLWLQEVDKKPVKVSSEIDSDIISKAVQELKNNWQGPANSTISLKLVDDDLVKGDGFLLTPNEIRAKTEVGLLYGVYEMLRHQKTRRTITSQIYNPSYEYRILDHWDNMNGSVERGYAGRSIFWRDTLEVNEEDRKRWKEYARANASIAINGSVINNVNSTPLVLNADALERVVEVAEQLRAYGIKTYLSVNFASPSAIGGLETADPLNPDVIQWWKEKVKEIYELIPDFGGFLVKANSEGQPGPQNFGRTHADGANMLARALKPFGGIVMWRAFVYAPNDEDRAKQAYQEFVPLDGEFLDNVIIQVKNGPIDFQPREPFSPLFGAMNKTPVMAELQVTKEYLGHSTHLVFLSPMWEEFLNTDTYQKGPGSTVARVTDGSKYSQKITAIAGVANTGRDYNWSGHLFDQANWYAFGRLAWNNQLPSDQIADEWLKLTFEPDIEFKDYSQIEWEQNFLLPVKRMMLESHEACVNYMTPLGLHHIMSADRHYGPGPWWGPERVRADWTPPYYHQAEDAGVGFDRTTDGSNAVSQYAEPLKSQFNDPTTCPEEYLLWFHHLPWDYELRTGLTLWEQLCVKYDKGVHQVRDFQKVWNAAEPYIDSAAFIHVRQKLQLQAENAIIWKDACLGFFQKFSQLPIPAHVDQPIHSLEALIERDTENLMRGFRNRQER